MLRALAQAAGQTVEARIVGPAANGATPVQLGQQTLNLHLPAPHPPGTVLTLAVQQAAGQLRLAVLSARPPAPAAAPASPPPAGAPATSVQLSPAALAGTPPAASPSAPPAVPPAPPGAAPLPAAPSIGAAAIAAPASPSPSSPPPSSPPPGAGSVPLPGPAPAPAGPLPQSMPYAPASPAIAPGPATPAAASAATALPPLAQAAPGGTVGQHPPAPAPPPRFSAPTPPSSPPAAGMSAPAALARMVQEALPRQDSIVGLTRLLAAASGKVVLPEPVLKAARQLMALPLAADDGKLDAPSLQRAVRHSGIFQEALLASGRGALAAGDLKSALMSLRHSLGAWLGEQAPVAPVGSVAPPLRGNIPRARGGGEPLPDLPEDPHDLGRLLLGRTEAALARTRLHQNASLPEPGARPDAPAQWSLDLPVVIAGQHHLLHMQIQREAEGDPSRPRERGWQVRFAIDFPDLGEVGAQISLRGKATGVMLWADRADTALLLSAGIEALRGELEAAGLMPGAVVVRTGAPPAQPVPAASGHFVDATR